MLIRPEGCNIRCPDARCGTKCRKIADWERRHAHELARYEQLRIIYPTPPQEQDGDRLRALKRYMAKIEAEVGKVQNMQQTQEAAIREIGKICERAKNT